MRLATRMLMLSLGVTLGSLLLLGRCGVNIDEVAVDTGVTGWRDPSADPSAVLLREREAENKAEVDRLVAQIRSLKLQLLHMPGGHMRGSLSLDYDPQDLEHAANATLFSSADCAAHVRSQLRRAELLRGAPNNNEHEVLPFSHFTFGRIYPADLGLGKRVVEKPMGFKRRDLQEALLQAVDSLNENDAHDGSPRGRYSINDFFEGLYRTDPTTGTQYELYFRSKPAQKGAATEKAPRQTGHGGYMRVSLIRPFAPFVVVRREPTPPPVDKETIHVVVPLTGSTERFRAFMDKFVKIALKNDRRVALSVVFFGDEGLAEARAIMARVVMARYGGGNTLRLLALNETFSRARGLRVGAESAWPDGELRSDALLFFSDVDVVFSARFLDRCRWNARRGVQVYYPIVFSLYNPHVAYTLQGRREPPENDQLVVSRDTGFWKDFGYDVSCQYRSDFLRLRRVAEDSTVGWPGEDIALYRAYVRSHIKVVRATDPGIFHTWHPQPCSGRNLPADQHRACIRSRALHEASHGQLGALAFRDEPAPKTSEGRLNTAQCVSNASLRNNTQNTAPRTKLKSEFATKHKSAQAAERNTTRTMAGPNQIQKSEQTSVKRNFVVPVPRAVQKVLHGVVQDGLVVEASNFLSTRKNKEET